MGENMVYLPYPPYFLRGRVKIKKCTPLAEYSANPKSPPTLLLMNPQATVHCLSGMTNRHLPL